MVTKINQCRRNILEFLNLQDNLGQSSIIFVTLEISNSNYLATNKLMQLAYPRFLLLKMIDEQTDTDKVS